MSFFSVQDLYLHRKVAELHSATGMNKAFGSVQSVLRAENRYASQIWAFPTDGSPPAPFTSGTGMDIFPRPSPDRQFLAFLSDREGGISQLYLMPLAGGEARQLGHFESGISSFVWAPDGKHIYLTALTRVDPDLRGLPGQPPPPGASQTAEVCWKLPYKKDGVGYMLDHEIHIYSLDVGSGVSEKLTEGPFNVLGLGCAPDSQSLAYTRSREGRFAHCSDLWVYNIQGKRHRRLTHEHALVMQPAWSPDGRWLAFAGALKEGDGESRLWLLEYATGKVRRLGDIEVADAQTLTWTASGDALLLVRAHRGRHEIVSVSVPDADIETLAGGDRQFGAFAVCGDALMYSVDTPIAPCEVFASDNKGLGERQLGALNSWWADRIALQMEPRQFKVSNGRGGEETIEGWLLRAKGHEGAAPLLVDVHGGPASYALLDYETNVYWHVMCSRGWAVLLLNAVGSSSFGNEFCSRLSGQWGKLDLPQYMQAIEQLQRQGACSDQVSIAGKSYGGYFAAWSIGHTSMFRSAVVMAPVGNIETHYGTSDGGYYADPLYIGTAPAFDRQKARQLSPLQSIEKATTPTLFMQGKDDERCPKCQSEELFVSLYRAGDTPAELVLYPGEGHSFLGEGKSACRADAARRIVDWLERFGSRESQQNIVLTTLETDDDEGASDRRQQEHEGTAEAVAQGHSRR